MTELSDISRTWAFYPYISGSNVPSLKNEKISLIFQEIAPSCHKLKKLGQESHSILLFNFTTDFYYCFSPNSLPWFFFCHVTLLPHIWQKLHCFYQGFPGNRLFFLESCKVSHWGSKRRTGLSIFVLLLLLLSLLLLLLSLLLLLLLLLLLSWITQCTAKFISR